MIGQKDLSSPQPTRIVERLSKGHGLAQVGQDTPQVAKRKEGRAQGEAEIDRLRGGVALVRQMPEGTEGLLAIPHGLAVGRLRERLGAGLLASPGGRLPPTSMPVWMGDT